MGSLASFACIRVGCIHLRAGSLACLPRFVSSGREPPARMVMATGDRMRRPLRRGAPGSAPSLRPVFIFGRPLLRPCSPCYDEGGMRGRAAVLLGSRLVFPDADRNFARKSTHESWTGPARGCSGHCSLGPVFGGGSIARLFVIRSHFVRCSLRFLGYSTLRTTSWSFEGFAVSSCQV